MGVAGIVPPLAIYLTVRTRAEIARIESKESLNWQLTGVIVCAFGTSVLSLVALILAGVGLSVDSAPLVTAAPYVAVSPAAVVGAVTVVFSIVAFLRVRSAGAYRYPFAIRLVK